MTIARRDFLKSAGGIALAGGYLAGTALATQSAAFAAETAFGFADDKVPMNAANLCPMPTAVGQAVERYGRELDRDMSHVSRGRIEALKENARAGLAGQLGVSADELAIVRNTSEANNIVVQGMELDAGDEVLLWEQNHPSNAVAWDVQAARMGCTVRRLSLPSDVNSIDEVVELFVKAANRNTRVVSFTHISNVSGFRLPAGDICAALRQKGDYYIHVDGAQTWGICDVNLRRLGCDSFSGSAHKWYMGPREVGLLYVRQPHIERIWPNCVSVPWGNEAAPSVTGARKFETFGQRDDAAIAALGDAADFHEALTPATVERRSTELAQRLRDGLADLGVAFVSPLHPDFHSNVVILSAPRENGAALVERLLHESGIIAAAVGGLRLAPHVYNTEAHIDRAIRGVAAARGLLG
ncbi:MAG: aminotransferase class V-fold PLP-dependent enzyme [Woeseia sp.]